ncbi:hypothetical protein DDE82_001121 [Stemphylium lycopersici]|nr:hypothetical protein DDE82_001121 [Stemphylium lycopersici]
MAPPQTSGSAESNGVLILWGSVDPEAVDEGDLNDWWTNEHLPERLGLPGFQRARRYRARDAKHSQNEYLALYDVSDVRDLVSAEYLYALNHPTERTAKFMPSLAKMSRFACQVIPSECSPVSISEQYANTSDPLFIVVFELDAAGLDHDPLLVIGEYLRDRRQGASTVITHARLTKVNQEVTKTGTASKSYDRVQFQASRDGEKGTEMAETLIALFEFRNISTDGSSPERPVDSGCISKTTEMPGLRSASISFIACDVSSAALDLLSTHNPANVLRGPENLTTMPSLTLPLTLPLSPTTSIRLRILQYAQLSIAALAPLFFLTTLILPVSHKLFTLSLLYTPLLTSLTTVFFIAREQKRAAAGTLTRQKYAKYQLLKMAAAFGMSFVAFIAGVASAPAEGEQDVKRPGEQGLWISGVKIGVWQGLLMWLGVFNWLFLWASLFYSCCMTGNRRGAIALEGDEARIGLAAENGTENDEQIARNLQAQDGNWQA